MKVPLSIPHLGKQEAAYVQDCFDTNFVSTAGPFVPKFEKAMADFLNVEESVAVVNGTAALHLALIECGVAYDDEVLVPNLTFVAPVNAVRYLGAHPILMDSHWETLGLCPESLKSFFENSTEIKGQKLVNKSSGRTIKAVIPMHTLGNCVDMDPILDLCREYKIKVIEDASESLGATYKGKKSGTLGDLGCFSFNGNKIMTTGGGGLVVSNDSDSLRHVKHLSTTAKSDALNFVHDEVGYNYRMVNVLAAIGLGQAEQLPTFIEKKRSNFTKYELALEGLKGARLFKPNDALGSNYWFYALVLDENLSSSKQSILRDLIEKGVEARPIWELMENLPAFKQAQKGSDMSMSRDIHQRVLNIPCSVSITDEEISFVSSVIKEVLESYL